MAGEQDGLDLTMPAPSGDAPTDLASDGTGTRGDEPDSLVGNVLAERYRIDRRLGSGGMGAVFAGTHLLLDRPVAIKVMKPRLGDDPGLGQRFLQEAQAASGIAHAHVVQITDFGKTESDAAYIVMEHLDGEDLAQTLQREGPMPWQRVVHIAEQIARALAAAHKQGIVHRDIKPANCFRVTRDDDPDFIKVLDFGLAKVIGEHSRADRSLTATGALLGTPGYIAPELYRGLAADHRVDLYALGAMMYKLLTGELPPMSFTARETSGVSQLHAPAHLQAIVRRALAEDPAARYPTAQALAADLKALAGGTGVALDPSSDPASSLGASKLLAVNRHGRRWSLTIGAPLLVLLLAGSGALIWFAVTRDDRDKPPTGVPPVVAVPPPAPDPPAPLAPVPAPVPEDPAPTPVATKRPHGKRPHADDPTTGPPVDLPSVTDDPAAPKDSPPADPTPVPPDFKGDPAPADTRADPAPVPTDTPTEPADPAKQGTPALLQKKIARACGSKLLSYTLKVQWTARTDGTLDLASVKPLEPATDLNADHTCALKQIKRSTYAWTPGKTYTHTFDIGG